MSKANDIQVGGSHYKHTEIQHWDWSWSSGHDPFQYQVTKYVDRHKRKNGLQDLLKAKHFLDKYIELLTGPGGIYQSKPGTGQLEREWEHGVVESVYKQEAESDSAGEEPGRGYVDQG